MTKYAATITALIPLTPLALAGLVFGGGTWTVDPDTATVAVADPEPIDVSIDGPGPVTVALTPSVAVVGADAEERARLDQALARFRDNGLELPDLTVRFSGHQGDCAGHLGLFEQSVTPWRLSICSELAFVPTHELAHAWEAANLTDDDRARHTLARGLASWNDPGVAWKDRGVEDVAFIIQQNLMATNPPLESPTWIERMGAYELLTGRPSPLLTER